MTELAFHVALHALGVCVVAWGAISVLGLAFLGARRVLRPQAPVDRGQVVFLALGAAALAPVALMLALGQAPWLLLTLQLGAALLTGR